ncbi:GAF domain-containing protein [Methanobacterium sp. ACI-7]|uniref:GAF domain-containing protein n=1 Tax=unclassified Methanobacterium TaxID=2627676 RepID=UPI0039C0B2B6
MIRKTEISKKINFSQDLLNIKERISGRVYSSSLKEISDLVFDEALKLTNSDYCYVAYVDPENKDSVGISFSHLTDACKMYAEMGEARFKVLSDGTYGGLLGYSLDTGESFYVHDISSHPAAHGLPSGHEPVDQFLSVPVKYGEKILGQIVLANPKEDYNDKHLKIAEKLADFYAVVLKEKLY